MKIKTTFKNIKAQKEFVIGVGYCGHQHLLRFFEPTLYNAGLYGWNCDFHPISERVGICTGYNYSKSCNIELYGSKGETKLKKLLEKLDNKAKLTSWNDRAKFIKKVQRKLENYFNERG